MKVASGSSSSGKGRGIVLTSLEGDSTLACIVNKGICGERMVWCGVEDAPIHASHTQSCFDF